MEDQTSGDPYARHFDKARREIIMINREAYGEKKRVIIRLAENLAIEGMPIHAICSETVKRLRDIVSPRFVRRCLDTKYKDPRQSRNAKKQTGSTRRKNRRIVDVAAHVPPKVEESAMPIAIDNSGIPAQDAHLPSHLPAGQPQQGENPITEGISEGRLTHRKAQNKSLTRVAASRQIIDKIIALDKNIKRHCFLYFNDNLEVVKVEPDGQRAALDMKRRQEQEEAAGIFVDVFL